MGIDGIENINDETPDNIVSDNEGSDVAEAVDEEQARRQAARDDSAAGAAEVRDNPGIDQGESSAVDERVPSTGESADEPDEEQIRRETARLDSERAREELRESYTQPEGYDKPGE